MRRPRAGGATSGRDQLSDGRGRKSNTRPVTAKYQASTSSSRVKKVPSIQNFLEVDSKEKNSFRNASKRREMTQAIANEDLKEVNQHSRSKRKT